MSMRVSIVNLSAIPNEIKEEEREEEGGGGGEKVSFSFQRFNFEYINRYCIDFLR